MKEVVSSIAASKLLLAPVSMAIYLALAVSTGVLMRQPLATGLGLICAVGYGGSFAWYFQGRQQGGTAVLTEALPQICQFALLLSLVRAPDQLWLVIALQAIPPMASISYALYCVRRDDLLGAISRSSIVATMRGSWPFFVERFCYATYTALMPSLIVLLSTKSEVAYYSIGDRFCTMIVSLAAPLTQAAMPWVAKAVSTSGGGWRLSIGLVVLEVLGIGAFAGVIFAVAGIAVHRFFPPDYAPAIVVARVFCMTSIFAATAFAITNFILIPRDRAPVMIWSSGAALVFGLIAQVVLVPHWGAVGAAYGRMVSEATVAIVLGVAALRLFQQRKSEPPHPAHTMAVAVSSEDWVPVFSEEDEPAAAPPARRPEPARRG